MLHAQEIASHDQVSPADEAELRWYFGLNLPGVPGLASKFGAMCERVGNATNPKTDELPTEGVSWTEILACGHGFEGVVANAAEDMMIDYIDAQKRVARMMRILDQLSDFECSVLRARYTCPESAPSPLGEFTRVALLTRAAATENRKQAMKAEGESVVATIARLVDAARNAHRSKQERTSARAKLARIRDEAVELTEHATHVFLLARGTGR